MRPTKAHLAIDLGAESGRVVLGVLEGERLRTHEVHRFAHRPIEFRTGLHWDIGLIWRETLEGIRSAAAWGEANSASIQSVGVDSWGVDFGFVTERGGIVGLPRCYRDERFANGYKRVAERVPPRELFEITGVQPMSINTLVQLAVVSEEDRGVVGCAEHIVLLPGLMQVLLGGKPGNEVTIASTTQLLDVRTGEWCRELMSKQGIACGDKFGACVPTASKAGHVGDVVGALTGLSGGTLIVHSPGHDTACAVAAVPALHGKAWCYISSGTWSLLGVEIEAPIITDASYEAGFTNELGVPRTLGGKPTVRFQKNIVGLWLVQECKRAFEAAGVSADYGMLTQEAKEAKPFRTLIDVNDQAFQGAGQMLEKIGAFSARTGQPVPGTPGEYVRACLESLAIEYRRTIREVESMMCKTIEVIHLVGGGGKNRLLNQMTADATGKCVIVGPYEGAAAGNILVQSMGVGGGGAVGDLDHLRRIVWASSDLETFEPGDGSVWAAASSRYESLLQSS